MSLATRLSPGTELTRGLAPVTFSPSAYVLVVQGIFYVLTGVWPLLSMDTFLRVTGPKTDLWLVQTVGVLIAVMGVVMLAAVSRRRAAPEVVVLAVGAALALIAVDVVFVTRGVIPRIYLLDAAVEATLILGWVVALTVEATTRWKRDATCL